METHNRTTSTVRRISTLDEHRALLKEVFRTAKQRILIVSPFISNSALKYDGIPDKVRAAVNRGVTVSVYTDNNLNRESSGFTKHSASQGISELMRSGAFVTVVEGIHNKTLVRDEDLITEGSFNWLSAVRTYGGIHQREERTMIVEGDQAKSMIKEELSRMTGKNKKTYKTKRKLALSVWIGFVIMLLILVAIIIFIPPNVKWMTFSFFAIGFIPVTILMLKSGKVDETTELPPEIEAYYENDDDSKMNYNNNYLPGVANTYVPGVTNFDGSYKE